MKNLIELKQPLRTPIPEDSGGRKQSNISGAKEVKTIDLPGGQTNDTSMRNMNYSL